MHDENGFFSRFNQCLYYARLHIDSATALEDRASDFSLQQQACYLEAAVQCLFRAQCFLICAFMPVHHATALLQSPRRLLDYLKLSIEEQPTAALQELYNSISGADSATTGQLDLSALLLTYTRQWQSNSSIAQLSLAKQDIIRLKQHDVTVEQCHQWYRALLESSERLHDYDQEC